MADPPDMRLRSILLLLLAAAVLAGAWHRRRPPATAPEPEPPVVLPSAAAEATAAADDAPPALAQVQPVLDGAFESTLVLDARARPPFLAGDLDGDGLVDLAAVVRPRDEAARARLNGDATRWRIQDAAGAPGDVAGRVGSDESLLAVVHGTAGVPWTGPGDRAAYVVRNAAGSGMGLRPLSDVPAAVRLRVTRAHAGHVIAEERGGQRGIVFWTGAAYAWTELR